MAISVFLDPAQMPGRTQDQTTFDNLMAQYFQNLPTFSAQINATATSINAAAVSTPASAQAAANAAAAATAAADSVASTTNVAPWVKDGDYTKYSAAISAVTFQTYRCKSAGVSSIDPAFDPIRWEAIGQSLPAIHAAVLSF